MRLVAPMVLAVFAIIAPACPALEISSAQPAWKNSAGQSDPHEVVEKFQATETKRDPAAPPEQPRIPEDLSRWYGRQVEEWLSRSYGVTRQPPLLELPPPIEFYRGPFLPNNYDYEYAGPEADAGDAAKPKA